MFKKLQCRIRGHRWWTVAIYPIEIECIRCESVKPESKAHGIVTKVNNNGIVDVLPYYRRGES